MAMSAPSISLESAMGDDLLRYFHLRKSRDQKQYAQLSDADLIFRNHAGNELGGERFERLYQRWKNDPLTRAATGEEIGSDSKKRAVEFETFPLNGLHAEEAHGG
jgi:hypothetical protein